MKNCTITNRNTTMDTKTLRQKILDLAIHGKLVPQDPNDEPASVLLERIKAEKERLIKEGKIKRSKKSAKSSDTPHYENVPFEVPDNWVWTTVNDISKSIIYGVSESAKSEGKYKLLRITDIQNNKVDWETVPFTDFDDDKVASYILYDGDIVFARTGATVGKSYLIKGLNQKAIYASYLIRVQTSDLILPEYVKLFFESGHYWEQIELSSVGIGQPNVNGTILGRLNIPLPPFAEQKRIVIEIERWLSLIDQIEDGKDNLQSTIKRTKSKILDLAIHGKLVPQDPNDEPAIELLKRINPSFTPCDNGHYTQLPEGWAACRLEQVADILDNLRKPMNSSERDSRIRNRQIDELYPYYGATGQVGLIDDYIINGNYLLLGEDGAPFLDKNAIKAYSINGKSWVNNHAHILSPKIDFEFLQYSLNQIDYSEYVNGSTRLKLTQTDMRSIKIMLPPLAEQKRIKSKIQTLFSQLNLMMESL